MCPRSQLEGDYKDVKVAVWLQKLDGWGLGGTKMKSSQGAPGSIGSGGVEVPWPCPLGPQRIYVSGDITSQG